MQYLRTVKGSNRNTLSYRNSALPSPGLEIQTIRWIVGGGRMGRSGNMLMFTEQSLPCS